MKAYPYVLAVIKQQDFHNNGNGTDNPSSPPVITHTAATPQGSPNATLTMQRDTNNRLCPEKALNISNPSIVTIDKSSVSSV